MPKIKKFARADRTFETRLLFIKALFESKYPEHVIMASCLEHKLDASLWRYMKELHKASWQLEDEDPMKILKRID